MGATLSSQLENLNIKDSEEPTEEPKEAKEEVTKEEETVKYKQTTLDGFVVRLDKENTNVKPNES